MGVNIYNLNNIPAHNIHVHKTIYNVEVFIVAGVCKLCPLRSDYIGGNCAELNTRYQDAPWILHIWSELYITCRIAHKVVAFAYHCSFLSVFVVLHVVNFFVSIFTYCFNFFGCFCFCSLFWGVFLEGGLFDCFFGFWVFWGGGWGLVVLNSQTKVDNF